MSPADFSDETLMAFADGELTPEEAARIESAMDADDELVARVALFTQTRAASKTALKPLLDEPVPPQLTSAIEAMIARRRSAEAPAGNVVALPARTPNRWMLPLAASLAAVVIGGLAGYRLAGSGAGSEGLQVAGIDNSELDDALATVAAGEERQLTGAGRRFRAIATFRDAGGATCREFEVDSADRSTVISVACLAGGQWRVSFAVAAAGNDAGYAPASSTQALDAYLAAIEAGEPMSRETEAEALRLLPAGQ